MLTIFKRVRYDRIKEKRGAKGVNPSRKVGTPMEIYPISISQIPSGPSVAPLIPPENASGRPRQVDMRAVQSADLLHVASWLGLAFDPA
jgi:hypothetical protein